ncbi:MAG: phage tail assembly protein [Candidatus Promineifilaceae bacterium]
MTIATEFTFVLPQGYIDARGQLHREGRMRLATALDEIEPGNDPRVQANELYLPILLLSRVVTQIGALVPVTPQVIEGLFAVDLAYLEDLYQRLNSPQPIVAGTVCPYCNNQIQLQVAPLS